MIMSSEVPEHMMPKLVGYQRAISTATLPVSDDPNPAFAVVLSTSCHVSALVLVCVFPSMLRWHASRVHNGANLQQICHECPLAMCPIAVDEHVEGVADRTKD